MAFAQAPSKINYQSVLRDVNGAALINQAGTLVFRIKSGGNVVWEKTSVPYNTSPYGVINVDFGPLSDAGVSLATLPWATTAYELQVLANNGSVDLGTRPFGTVPYAMYAASAGSTGQPVTITGGGATTVTGTYPDFTVTSTDANTTYTAGAGININASNVISNTILNQQLSYNATTGALTIDNGGNANGNSVNLPIPTAPTIQRFLSGSGTYTTPANVLYIEVEMIGGGGGGSGASGNAPGNGGGAGGYLKFMISNPAATYNYLVGSGGTGGPGNGLNGGTDGTSTVFGSNIAGGGLAGQGGSSAEAGAGGVNSFFTGTVIVNMQGNGGECRGAGGNGIPYQKGGSGGAGYFGGGTNTGGGTGQTAYNAPANSGSGAAGGSGTNNTSGGAGGIGGSGIIIVKEYYK